MPGVTVNLYASIVDGKVDVNGDGAITAADDGVLGSMTVTDGVIYENGAPMNGILYGVAVIDGLLDLNSSGVASVDDDGLLWLDTTVTDADGYYLFEGLPDGSYVVKVDTTTVSDLYVNTYDEDDGHTARIARRPRRCRGAQPTTRRTLVLL